MSRKLLSRRNVVVAGGGAVLIGAAGVAASGFACSMTDGRQAWIRDLSRLFAAIPDMAAPQAVGRVYGAEHGPEMLLAQLSAEGPLKDASQITCEATRCAAIQETFRQDFTRGRIVVADRWIVARSEALISAAWVMSGQPV